MKLDFSEDYQVWDNLEDVLLVSVRDSGDVTFPVQAIRQQVSFRESAQTGGVLTQRDCHWLFPQKLLPAVVKPKVGDRVQRLTADLTEWTLLDQGFEDFDQVWDCLARNFVLSEQLRDTINILTPLIRQDAATGRVAEGWPIKAGHGGIPARIQETASSPVNEGGRIGEQVTFDIHVGRRVRVTSEELVEDQLGNRYEILSSDQADRIEVLQVIRARRVEPA